MGAGLLFFSNLSWAVEGFTLAHNQYDFIHSNIPEVSVSLRSYDSIEKDEMYAGIYAIESLWYSSWEHTLDVWSHHLQKGGRVAIIDDFASTQSLAQNDPTILNYVEGWLLQR